MGTIAGLQKSESERLVQEVNATLEKLDGGANDVVLDFSGVRRVAPAALRALEKLAATSEANSAKVVLREVNVEVYKVLKLARLSGRFGFVN